MERRSHAPHHGRFTYSTDERTSHADSPSLLLEPESEHVRALLEQLDDVVFMAIQGDSSSLELAHELWPQVVDEIGWELIEESREQYLRYATDLARRWDIDKPRDPALALAALEVIELLTR